MTKILISCVAFAVALVWSSPVLATTLDALPECPAGTPDEMVIYSAHDKLVVGRSNAFRAEYEGIETLLDEPWQFSAELDGQPVEIENASASRFEITPQRPGTLRVAVTYGLGSRGDYEQESTLRPCRTVGPASWKVVDTRRFPDPIVRTSGEHVEFSLTRIADGTCTRRYERAPIAVRVRQRSGRRMVVKAHADDPCRGFETWTDSLRSPWWRTFHFGGMSDYSPRRTLTLALQWPEKKSATWSYDYVVRAGRAVQRGVIQARSVYHPAERVYAWLPGGQVNDDYWNICVNDGKRIAMHNGNAYCNVGGYSDWSLRIVRRP